MKPLNYTRVLQAIHFEDILNPGEQLKVKNDKYIMPMEGWLQVVYASITSLKKNYAIKKPA